MTNILKLVTGLSERSDIIDPSSSLYYFYFIPLEKLQIKHSILNPELKIYIVKLLNKETLEFYTGFDLGKFFGGGYFWISVFDSRSSGVVQLILPPCVHMSDVKHCLLKTRIYE